MKRWEGIYLRVFQDIACVLESIDFDGYFVTGFNEVKTLSETSIEMHCPILPISLLVLLNPSLFLHSQKCFAAS